MLNQFVFDDAIALHEGMCEKLMFGTEWGVDVDWSKGTEVGLHNVLLGAESFEWEYDLSKLWMPKSRWNLMVRQYLDPEAVNDWFDKIEDRLVGRGRGIAVLRTKLVQGRGTGRGVRRRWGSCMLSVSYRTNPVPTITLHSRTTYFGYLAAMDVSVAHVLASYVSSIVGIPVEQMRFVWFLELAQFHGFRSLAWPLSDPEIKAGMDEDLPNRQLYQPQPTSKNNGDDVHPGYRKALDGYHRLVKSDDEGKLYGDEAFSSFARVRRRFHAQIMGAEFAQQFEGGSLNRGGHHMFKPLPPLHTTELDLSPIGIYQGEEE
jgi:hypothetical protein